ncbi:MAG: adenylate/guanylate cyclase domain-containing protein [Burkholderiales bacterium]
MESSSRTLVCSVLFLDIIEYSKKPVAEQLQLKQAFNRSLSTALEQVPQRDRIILDTGDGAAVTFMGDPEDALFAALTVRNMAAEVPVRLGVNLGPVRLVKDLNGQMNIIGDGINVAQRVMSFARPGQLLVSRSFYEVVSCLSRDYLNLFRHEGSRTDKHVREHEVYSVVGGTPTTRRLAHTESQIMAREGGWLAGAGPLGFRRSALMAAPLAFLLLVGGGVAARSMMDPQPASAARPKARIAAPEKKPQAADKPAAPASGNGRLELAVLPWGEVVVNGKSRGVSPPLRALEIPPGLHTIELRNSTFPSHVEKIDVKAGEAVRIRHRFGKKK